MIRRAFAWMILLALFAPAHRAFGETIELRVKDIAQFATISPDAPRHGWVGYNYGDGTFGTTRLDVSSRTSVLVQYDLSVIPDNMRITNAQWALPIQHSSSSQVQLYTWRILAPWGPGACHAYRTTLPKPAPWRQPGARAMGVDRTIRPTVVVKVGEETDELALNVTRDVEYWHSGLQPNRGWILTVEQNDAVVSLESPMYIGIEDWILRITYEPR